MVSAQTAFLDVGAGRAAAPRFYARVGGRCFRRRWPSGSNGTPAVHRRTIPDAPCARTRSKRVRGTPKTLFRPLGTPRARCGAILGSDIPRGMCPQQGSGPRSRGDRCATLRLRRATGWRRRELRPSTLPKGCSEPDCLSCFSRNRSRFKRLPKKKYQTTSPVLGAGHRRPPTHLPANQRAPLSLVAFKLPRRAPLGDR